MLRRTGLEIGGIQYQTHSYETTENWYQKQVYDCLTMENQGTDGNYRNQLDDEAYSIIPSCAAR